MSLERPRCVLAWPASAVWDRARICSLSLHFGTLAARC